MKRYCDFLGRVRLRSRPFLQRKLDIYARKDLCVAGRLSWVELLRCDSRFSNCASGRIVLSEPRIQVSVLELWWQTINSITWFTRQARTFSDIWLIIYHLLQSGYWPGSCKSWLSFRCFALDWEIYCLARDQVDILTWNWGCVVITRYWYYRTDFRSC